MEILIIICELTLLILAYGVLIVLILSILNHLNKK